MANWSKNKTLPANINNGNEYAIGDNVALEDLNAITNNSFYAMEKADEAKTLTNNFSNPNLLINGDFRINQRGKASYTGNNIYTVDRWLTYGGSSASIVPNSSGTINIQILQALSNGLILVQMLEQDFSKYVGQTFTFSTKTKLTGTGTYNVSIRQYDSNRDEISSVRKDITITQNAISSGSSTIDTNCVEVRVLFRTVSAVLNDVYTIEWAKLEVGGVATPFSPRPYAEELALCQRYYQRFNTGDNYSEYALGFLASKTSAQFQFPLTQTLRTTPTLVVSGNDNFTVRFGNQSDGTLLQIATTGMAIRNVKQNNVFITASWTTELNVNYSVATLRSKVSTSYIAFDAEIY